MSNEANEIYSPSCARPVLLWALRIVVAPCLFGVRLWSQATHWRSRCADAHLLRFLCGSAEKRAAVSAAAGSGLSNMEPTRREELLAFAEGPRGQCWDYEPYPVCLHSADFCQ